MDPNANLAEQARILYLAEDYGPEARRLAELYRALRGWLQSGGFAPDWSKHPDAAAAFQGWHARQDLHAKLRGQAARRRIRRG